jgi:hypothetical protein
VKTQPLGLFLALSMVCALSPARIAAAEPLERVPLAVGIDGLFAEPKNDGRQRELGSWRLVAGRLGADSLHLTLRIQPPTHGLPVEAGPSVLLGGLRLFGDAGGDVAVGMAVEGLASVTLPPCQGAPCEFEADINLSTAHLPAAINKLEQRGRLTWVSAEMTVVRTFGGGAWLQVLPLQFAGDALHAAAGRLGAVRPTAGTIFPFGAFPARAATPVPADPLGFPEGFDYAGVVDGLRRAAGDASSPLVSAPAALNVAISPRCEGSPVLTVHDEAGDWIFQRPLRDQDGLVERLDVPVAVSWWLTLHDGGGIDFDQGRQGWGLRVGPIGSTGEPVEINAVFDCLTPRGSVQMRTAETRPTTPSPSLASVPAVPSAAPSLAMAGFVAIVLLAGLVVLVGAWHRTRRKPTGRDL